MAATSTNLYALAADLASEAKSHDEAARHLRDRAADALEAARKAEAEEAAAGQTQEVHEGYHEFDQT